MLLLNLLLLTDGLSPSARQATSPNIKMRVEHKRSSPDSLPVTVSLQPMIHSLAELLPFLLFLNRYAGLHRSQDIHAKGAIFV